MSDGLYGFDSTLGLDLDFLKGMSDAVPSGWDFGPLSDFGVEGFVAKQQPSGWDFGPLSNENMPGMLLMASQQSQEPSFMTTLNDSLGSAEKWLRGHDKLLQYGVGGLGALGGYLDARKRNKLNRQALDAQNAELARRRAESMKYNDPVRYQLMRQKVAAPVGGRNEALFFSDNALGANPMVAAARGGYINGDTHGQADQIPAMLSDGEFVFDAETVSMLGDGNNAAGASVLERMRQNIRAHKRGADTDKVAPKAKRPEQYMKGKK